MAAKMSRAALKAKEVFQQYSKKMATRVTVFWMIYRIAAAILTFFRPEIANAMSAQIEGVDTIMIVNMSVYTGNSATEKIAIAFGRRGTTRNSEDEEGKDADEGSEECENG